MEAYYAGFEAPVSATLATAGWGWHVETGLHALRLVLGGVFDRFPGCRSSSGIWARTSRSRWPAPTSG